MLNQPTSLLVLFLNLLYFCLFIPTINTHTHTKSIKCTHILTTTSMSYYLLEAKARTSLRHLYRHHCISIGSFSPRFRYSWTAETSFCCSLSLLINHVTFEDVDESFACCHKPNRHIDVMQVRAGRVSAPQAISLI